MKTIDFATVSLQDALDLAVLIEDEAADRYQEMADQLEGHHTAAAAEFFHFMVKNETKHRDELAKRRVTLFGDAKQHVDRSMLWDVEAPAYDKVRAFMSVREALAVALACEVKAHQFFVDAIVHVHNPEVRKLFEELRHEETVHQEMIRKQLADLPPEQPENSADYVDEPVAQ